jgi:hypothetical protein
MRARREARVELPQIDPAFSRLVPRIGLAIERELQPLPERATALRVLEHALLHVVEAHARDVVHRALEVVPSLAVELQEGAGVFEHLGVGRHLARGTAPPRS